MNDSKWQQNSDALAEIGGVGKKPGMNRVRAANESGGVWTNGVTLIRERNETVQPSPVFEAASASKLRWVVSLVHKPQAVF